VAGIRLIDVPVGLISPNPKQPREVFEPEALDELVTSLREVGVLQPIVVRTDPANPERFELIMGERRWRAAQRAGFERIPAIVRETPDDELLRDALLENLHRSQLNPLEEGAAYQQLLTEFGVTHEELAARIGRSRSQVTNTIRLLGLPASVQRRVAAGVLSAGHARALLALANPADAEVLANRIVAEGLSVRSVEEMVALTRTDRKARAPRQSRTPAADPRTEEFATRVADHLDTSVHVEVSRTKSRLIVEVADIDDLARVVALILERTPAAAENTL
jgi:ParB family chromosome partitioning protein